MRRAARTGELVLTNLGRLGIAAAAVSHRRYRAAAAEDGCECGSHDLALKAASWDARDDMLVVRGVNVYPSAMDDVLRASGGVAEYRVDVQNSHAMAELRSRWSLRPSTRPIRTSAHRLEMALVNAFALRIPVRLVPAGSLPRFEMKARRWRRTKPQA